MEKKKSIVLGMTIAAVFLIAAVGSASAVECGPNSNPYKAVCNCGDTVVGSYTFDAPMTCSGGEGSGNPQHGLIIGANDIVINGDNFALTGGEHKCTGVGEYSPQSADCGIINMNYDNVTIKNLEVENFCTGIALLYAEENTVHHCNIHHNGNDTDNLHASATNGMHLITLDNSTIRNNWIHDNVAYHHSCDCGGGGNGIFQMALCDHNDIVHNNLTGNQKAGFFTKMHCTDNDISYNNATGNGLGGIILRCMMSNYNRIEENNASDNCGVGIYIRGSDNVFRNNTVMRNNNCSLYHTWCTYSPPNQVIDQGGVGVKVQCDAGPNELRGDPHPDGNKICENENWDIYDECGNLWGDNNTCDSAYNYHDGSAGDPPPCVYMCPNPLDIDLKIMGMDITWHNEAAQLYNVSYTVMNTGSDSLQQSNATHAGILIAGVLVDTQYVPRLYGDGGSHSNVSGPHPVNMAEWVNGAQHIDRVEVCADINDEENNENENNNCYNKIFGGADLVLTGHDWNWSDPSKKNFTVNYTVCNFGDIDAGESTTRIHFFDSGHSQVCWSNDPNPVPALAVGVCYTSPDIGEFTMPGTSCYIKFRVDAGNSIKENNEGANNMLQFMPSVDYPGCCDKCGDVDCDGDVFVGTDATLVFRNAIYQELVDCEWAADVDCDGDVFVGTDATLVFRNAIYQEPLDCCEGSCPL